jgi:hypothetical protein
MEVSKQKETAMQQFIIIYLQPAYVRKLGEIVQRIVQVGTKDRIGIVRLFGYL